MNENEIAKEAVNICFNIHKAYGPGLFESVYEELFSHELKKTGIEFKRQHPVPLIHESLKMEVGFRADMILDNKVIIEFKSVESLSEVFFKQILTYLKLTNCRLGLLVNFNVAYIKDGIHRIVNRL